MDGQFSGGLDARGALVGEWSDVTPQAFITRATDGAMFRTTRDDARKSSLLWAALSPSATAATGNLRLHLFNESLATLPREFAAGEVLAQLDFPLRLDGFTLGVSIRLEAVATPGPASLALSPGGTTFYDVWLVIDGAKAPAKRFGLAAVAGFGRSPDSGASHLLVEAELPLVIPAGFGAGFPADGLAGNGRGLGYLPDPAYWGASAAGAAAGTVRAGLAVASRVAAQTMLCVNPDASLTLDAGLLPRSDCATASALVCPPNLVVTTTAALDPARVFYPLPTTPECVGLKCDPPPGSLFPAGVSTVVCTLTPASGPTKTCSFTVTVAPPGISCPEPIVAMTDPGRATARVVFNLIPPPGAEVFCTPKSGSQFPLGVTTVRCRTKGGDAPSHCEFTVQVVDHERPRFTFCPADVTVECGRNFGPEKCDHARATDNSGHVTVSFRDEKTNGPRPIVKRVLRTWTATDAAGNQATCRQSITIVDTSGPQIHRLAAVPARVPTGAEALVAVQLEQVIEDGCSALAQITRRLQVSVKDPAGLDAGTYFSVSGTDTVLLRPKPGVVYTITLTCADFFGNTTSRSVVVPVL